MVTFAHKPQTVFLSPQIYLLNSPKKCKIEIVSKNGLAFLDQANAPPTRVAQIHSSGVSFRDTKVIYLETTHRNPSAKQHFYSPP